MLVQSEDHSVKSWQFNESATQKSSLNTYKSGSSPGGIEGYKTSNSLSSPWPCIAKALNLFVWKKSEIYLRI